MIKIEPIEQNCRYIEDQGLCRTIKGAALILGFATLLTIGCGAENLDSTARDPYPSGCPSADELTPRFNQLLRSGAFEGLRGVLEELSRPESDGTRSRTNLVIGILLELIKEVNLDGVKVLFNKLLSSEILEGLLPPLVDLLRFISGKAPGHPTTYYHGADILSRLLKGCYPDQYGWDFHPEDLLTLLDGLVELDRDGDGRPDLLQLTRLLQELADTPMVRAALEDYLSTEGKAGLLALLENVITVILHEDDLFDKLRELLGSVPGLEVEAPPLSKLLDLLGGMLDPSPPPPAKELLTPIRKLFSCLQRQDPHRVLASVAHDALEAGGFDLQAFTVALAGLFDDDAQRSAYTSIKELIAYFQSQKEAFKILVDTLSILLSTRNAEQLIPALLLMLEKEADGSRVIDELIRLIRQLFQPCRAN